MLKKIVFLAKKHIKKPYRRRTVSVWIISVPKSGRTWLRAMLGIYIAKHYDYEMAKSLDLRGMSKALGMPLISLSHNGSDFKNKIVAGDRILADPRLWKKKKVIHISRDVKDVMVSAYHHASFRGKSFNGDMSAFIRNPTTGAEKILAAEHRWKQNRGMASGWLDLTYIDMQKDPKASLLKVVSFIGLPEDESAAEFAVDFSSVDNMRKLEKEGFFHHGSMRTNNSGDKGMKVRSAQSGGYKNFLSDADIEYIDLIQQSYLIEPN